MTEKKIEIDIKKIIKTEDSDRDAQIKNKINHSANFARLFLWLAHKFIEEKINSVTTSEIFHNLSLSSRSYTFQLVEPFVILGILKKIKTSYNVRYGCTDRTIFFSFEKEAKEKLGLI